MRSRVLIAIITLTFIIGSIATAIAVTPQPGAIDNTWARTDRPIADGQVNRTWMWGPEANTNPLTEAYVEAPGGQRTVQYFDKSRMEITYPAGDQSDPWYVTNGLLVVELISGRMQTGDNTFVDRAPAAINAAGDQNDANGITYQTLGGLLNAAPFGDGTTITAIVDHNGTVGSNGDLATYGVTAGTLVPATNHRVASVFWDFMNSTGLVYEDGSYVSAPLFQNPYFATGFPITEAYWATISVAGVPQNVLIQAFERRVLTYTPGNSAGWQVEAGNVGQHYYQWRYQEQPSNPPPAGPPAATPTATAPSPAVPTATATATSTPPPTATSTAPPPPTATPTSPPPPTATPTLGFGCHPSYPDHCVPPPPPDWNCPDVPENWKPLRVIHNVPDADPHDLDRDGDGWACEPSNR